MQHNEAQLQILLQDYGRISESVIISYYGHSINNLLIKCQGSQGRDPGRGRSLKAKCKWAFRAFPAHRECANSGYLACPLSSGFILGN